MHRPDGAGRGYNSGLSSHSQVGHRPLAPSSMTASELVVRQQPVPPHPYIARIRPLAGCVRYRKLFTANCWCSAATQTQCSDCGVRLLRWRLIVSRGGGFDPHTRRPESVPPVNISRYRTGGLDETQLLDTIPCTVSCSRSMRGLAIVGLAAKHYCHSLCWQRSHSCSRQHDNPQNLRSQLSGRDGDCH